MITSKDIQSFVCKHWLVQHHCPYVITNFNPGFREMDIVAINGSNYLTEFEVKVSRSDFFADFNKEPKHEFYSKTALGETCFIKHRIPNKFFYCCPKGLIEEHEVPEYAGLIHFSKFALQDRPGQYYVEFEYKKKAPYIHKQKVDNEVVLKICRAHSQRFILGCSLMTYQNRDIKAKNEVRREQYEQTNKRNMQSLAAFQQELKKAGLKK